MLNTWRCGPGRSPRGQPVGCRCRLLMCQRRRQPQVWTRELCGSSRTASPAKDAGRSHSLLLKPWSLDQQPHLGASRSTDPAQSCWPHCRETKEAYPCPRSMQPPGVSGFLLRPHEPPPRPAPQDMGTHDRPRKGGPAAKRHLSLDALPAGAPGEGV